MNCPRVNLPIFQLTPPRRTEMVRLLHVSAAGTGRCIQAVQSRRRERETGGNIVAIASANELWTCAFFVQGRACAFDARPQLGASDAK